ncbi:hypothetical protein ACFWMG_02715 [Streptomyces sp. NPDC127074]|uniref:hypothetical protein n=1 Tax=Streptomyces sp. NPDC127074 TaxID=3347130 RepID=UPI00364D7FA4
MSRLTHQEKRHVDSLEAIRHCELLEVQVSALGELGRPFDAMPPPHEYDADWSGVEYDPDLAHLMPRFEEISASWTTRPPLPKFGGEFSVAHLAYVLSQQVGPWVNQEPTEFRRQFMASLRCIDSTPNSGSGRMSFLRMRSHVSPLEIWYSDIADIGGEPYPPGYVKLDLSYSQYLEALLLTKGMFGWQYLYAEMSLRGTSWSDVRNRLKVMVDVFPEIFPQYDYTELRERLEARL